jgi:hypothetical protein
MWSVVKLLYLFSVQYVLPDSYCFLFTEQDQQESSVPSPTVAMSYRYTVFAEVSVTVFMVVSQRKRAVLLCSSLKHYLHNVLFLAGARAEQVSNLRQLPISVMQKLALWYFPPLS